MKSSFLAPALVAGAVGCASAFLTASLVTPGAGERAAVLPARAQENGELQARLEEQEQELTLLRERVAQLESRPALAPRVPVASSPAESSADVAARTDLVPLGGEEVSGAFVANVGVALEQIRAQEELEAAAEREAARLERIDQRLERLQERLGLSEYQVDEMRGTLRRHETLREELRALREDGDRELYREQRRALDEETRASLATILTPEQLEGYERSEQRDGRNERGGNSDRGGGGGAGNGNGNGDGERRNRGGDRGQRRG